jgi:uncharacterized protein YkwD
MIRISFITFFFLVAVAYAKGQRLNEEERKLYQLLMQYRKQHGLPAIPLSPSLTKVAQWHAKDLQQNNPDTGMCNLHSWSNKGHWEPCCYTEDHAQANCMWQKPAALTAYRHTGFEIAYVISSGKVRAAHALASWKNSEGHNQVIINKGTWQRTWRAIGIGIVGRYAVVWFGEAKE